MTSHLHSNGQPESVFKALEVLPPGSRAFVVLWKVSFELS